MKVIFISHQDYANFSFDKSESLKLFGVDAESLIYKKHPFGYSEQAKVIDQAGMKKQIAEADVIHVMHSCGTMWDLVKETGKKIYVWHTGTRYRTEPEKHNSRWNPIIEKSIYALGEFENLGCKNGEYFSMTINTDKIKFVSSNNSKITFGHFPSNPQVKGTTTIMQSLSELNRIRFRKFEQNVSVKRCDFNKQLKRIEGIDVYIEMCATRQGTKPYGSFGTTALECSAMGKPTITNMLWENVYKKYYGEHKLIIANSGSDLKKRLVEFCDMNLNELKIMSEEVRNFVEEKHSYQATGKRLLNYL